ncbi:MAG: hypothetical protein IKM32_04755 [Clostridia bacterium]|nr:hypothetical protein [Clostridia bacterium]MBR6783985.1 hypothetical protein [Clostridia bacterium]
MKRINNEAILDLIYDLADQNGLRIDDFIEKVEEEFGEQPIDTEGLPENIIAELEAAKSYRAKERKSERMKKSDEAMAEDIKRFRELFPDISAEAIPESVWEEVENGVGLAHAYALYALTEDSVNRIAEGVNRRNDGIGAKAESFGATEPSFTKEQVEKMSGKDVKSNYKSILKAMKSWRY